MELEDADGVMAPYRITESHQRTQNCPPAAVPPPATARMLTLRLWRHQPAQMCLCLRAQTGCFDKPLTSWGGPLPSWRQVEQRKALSAHQSLVANVALRT